MAGTPLWSEELTLAAHIFFRSKSTGVAPAQRALALFMHGDFHPAVLPSQLLKVHLAARQPTATTLRDSMKGNGTQAKLSSKIP